MDTEIVAVDERYISPLVPVAEAIATYEAMRDFIKSAMVAGRDYGVIPGTKKPTLLQPGAEKLMRFFSLDFVIVPGQHITDWTGQDHGGEPFFYYEFTGQAMRGSRIVAECVGSCNSWEKKYRYRQGNRVCPNCGQPTIFKSKNDPGFYCWAKKCGCGSVFLPDDERITKQETGMVKNPDIFDTVNTLQKMSIKRSLVGVSLIACNAHEYFTQDLEDHQNAGDYIEGEFEEINGKKPQSSKPTTPAKLKPREETKKEKNKSESDPKGSNVIQQYWDAVKSRGLTRETGIKISQEAGLDFALATEKLITYQNGEQQEQNNAATNEQGQEKLGI